MTLTKTRPKQAPISHRKRSGQHHKQSHGYIKAYWPYLPILAILSFGMFANSLFSASNHNVMGYATEMSVQNLLNETNSQRVANGLGSLAINGQLDQAAQAKANDMAARDYWSHNTPDGQTPWTFVTAAGYSYQTVGENLAYGFATSADTITGWMNSAPHRANVLNTSYVDVGFGIINIPNYQGTGPETLVVAMYGSPASKAVAAATPPPSSIAKQTPPKVSAPTPVATPAPAQEPVAPVPTTTQTEAPKAQPTKSDTVMATNLPTETVSQKRVSRIQLLTAGNASWSMFALSLIACGAFIIFILRHSLAWHKSIVRGERFMLHHPIFDIAAVSLATIGYVLTQTSGLIR